MIFSKLVGRFFFFLNFLNLFLLFLYALYILRTLKFEEAVQRRFNFPCFWEVFCEWLIEAEVQTGPVNVSSSEQFSLHVSGSCVVRLQT